MTEHDEIIETGRRWAEAELAGDRDALDSLLTDDFRGVGAMGFVLDKAQWIARHDGATYTALEWADVDVRRHGDTAVAIGRQYQEGVFRGHAADAYLRYLGQTKVGPARATATIVRQAADHAVCDVVVRDAGADGLLLVRATVTCVRR